MKLMLTFLLFMSFIDPARIGKINTAKKEARQAYVDGDYKKAVQKYQYLADSLAVTEDEVMLNLGNAYFLTNDTAHATATYQTIVGSTKPQIRSKAQQQLGILNHKSGKLDEALNNFKQAIKADANNVDARYNYEMLKKKLDEQKKKDEQKNKDKKTPEKPSEYAKRLKEQADALVGAFKFSEAQNLMLEGAKKDASVMYYNDFIERLKEVVVINKK